MASNARDIQLRELKDTIVQLNTTIETQNTLIASLQKTMETQNAEKDHTIAGLTAQLEYLKHKLFGSSSERWRSDVPGQLNLFSDYVSAVPEEEVPPEIIEPEFVQVQVNKEKKPPKPKASYDEQFANLPVQYVEVDTLTEEDKLCPVCGTAMVPIGHEEIRTELKYTKPKLERIIYVGTTYGCPVCKGTEEPQFIKDEGVPALIPGSYVSPFPGGTYHV